MAWLAYIEETDSDIIADVLKRSRSDSGARVYFLVRAEEVQNTLTLDDRR